MTTPPAAPDTIALSLVSHTNVGKTTLARTLLGRDIGEVRDEAHVTLEAERHLLVASEAGDRLELWDTPGFGDSVRLARRLAQAGNPIGWFLSEVWDRFRDRGLWSSQRAVRNVLEQADVVLYLVNASESPRDVAYLDPELQVLDLVGKPVIVLLNQLGAPRGPGAEFAEVARWRERIAGHRGVQAVLALDAFARCWVQEGTLLDAIAQALPAARRPAFMRLAAAWRRHRRDTWQASMAVLARRLARAALDREAVSDAGWTDGLKDIAAVLGVRREGVATSRERAMQALARRLDDDIRAGMHALIALHQLEGRAAGIVIERLAEHFAAREPLSEGKAALWGGVVTGALAGLKADILSGGLTLGGGLLAGGVLGALGAAGLARGVNRVRGVEVPTIAWSDKVLDELAASALLGYLAVAHYGRGRGQWADAEHPQVWQEAVDAVVAARREALHALWHERDGLQWNPDTLPADTAAWLAALARWFDITGTALLSRLYPDVAEPIRAD